MLINIPQTFSLKEYNLQKNAFHGSGVNFMTYAEWVTAQQAQTLNSTLAAIKESLAEKNKQGNS